jgi:ABC-2 type transport system ATP-binding protein
VLDVIELTKVFRDFWGRESVKAVDGLNFDVRRGEVFGLLGPNGSGKTTTVRMVLGLLFPSQGAIRLFGRNPGDVEVKKRIGYMPEESHLYGYLDAEETLDFYGRLFRLPRAERRMRRDALIDMVGLRRARNRAIGQYSKGMARRIGLAQALINDPDFLILDEPTTGLDPIGTREMKDLILTLRDRGKTILLCSHLLADVEEVCDRICILYGGRVRAIGAVGDLLTKRDVTQIRTQRLEGDGLDRVLSVIQQTVGQGVAVEVSSPTRPLEDYFLDVVEEARREKLRTDGAERGTAAAAFLSGQAEGGKLLEDLLKAGQEAPQPSQAAAEPQAAVPVEQDGEFIEELVRMGSTDQPAAQQTDEPAASVTPETGVRQDVLDDLMAADDESTEGDEDKAG